VIKFANLYICKDLKFSYNIYSKISWGNKMHTIDNLFFKERGDASLAYDFDGTLEEFYASEFNDDNVKEFLSDLDAQAHSLRITVNLKDDIRSNITNQIIHYKDAFKINNPALVIPYILYGQKEQEDRAVILMPNEDCAYVYGKALYYCLTEKEGLFDQAMNQILALVLDPERESEIKTSLYSVFSGTESLGYIQRQYDRYYIQNGAHLKELCVTESNRVFNNAKEKLVNAEDKEPIVREAIARCYLLKKVSYVNYMKNKNLLATKFDGNIREMRNKAKEVANSIPFVAFSELWRYPLTEAPKLEQVSKEEIYKSFLDEEDKPSVEIVEEEVVTVTDDDKAMTPEEFARKALGLDEEVPEETEEVKEEVKVEEE